MSEIKLKPCPFCGGEAKIVMSENIQSPFRYYGECTKCGAHHNNKGASRDEASFFWNDFVKCKTEEKRVADIIANLKPCPFCGKKDSVGIEDGYVYDDFDGYRETGDYFVRCRYCDLMFGYDDKLGGNFSTMEDAANAWNRRVSA